ncbi:MAG: insulinase family protein [Caldilineaceae bacterium]|nr:insulinase family protein [Caldilineaceae bacterium]
MTNRLLLLLLSLLLLTACQFPPPAAISDPDLAAAAASREGAPGPLEVGLDQIIPIDPAIRTGRLENGLTYYVRANREPVNRAELWLAINAGSLQEDDDQQGLAHFLEHMLFNGTARFPEQALIDFFESVGMTFGPDINAYTSFDETVYMLRFPMDDPQIVDNAFAVLEDWAGYATIDPAQVELERGVVVEEERLRDQNASGRINKQILPFLLGDSLYAERMPIGQVEIIRNAPSEALRRFYTDWYRPDLMAIIAVGDFDVDEFEKRIRASFADLPSPETPRERAIHTVPDNEEPTYLIVTDPEFPVTIVEIDYRQPSRALDTAGAYREMLVGALFERMLNLRLEEISREADSPFVGAGVGSGNLVRTLETLSVSAQVQDEEVLLGLEAILTEVERVRRHGFTSSELERAKEEILNRYQRLYNERNNSESGNLADEYKRNFLEDEAIPGIAYEYLLAGRFVPEITIDEVNRQADSYVGEKGRAVLVIAPQSALADLPDETALARVIASIDDKEIAAYTDTEVADALLAETPAPVAIASRTAIEAIDTVDLELANGVRVLLKATEFKEDEVIFSAFSPGGSSLVSDADYTEAVLIANVVSQSGLNGYSYNEVLRILSGQSVNVSPYIDETEEGFVGGAGDDFLPALFQMIYLYGTAPQADEAAFSTLQDQARAFLRNRATQPNAAWQDAITQARYGDSIRQAVLSLAEVEALDRERAFAIYNERFADFSDFTFVFVGHFDIEQMVEWSQIYMGNLPSTGREETWVDVSPDPPTGVVKEAVFKGQEAQSLVQILFTGPVQPTPENRLRLRLLEGVLDILAREELREKRSGVYASSVSADLLLEPDELYEVSIVFGTDPERVDELVDALFALIADVQVNGPRPDLMEKAKAQLLRQREEDLEDNGFWLDLLAAYASAQGQDPAETLNLAERLDAIDAASIQAAAVEFLPADRYIEVALYPEGFVKP